jgi:DNA polymerase I-like protein with 3'-5' exonuclease and polymerase domains
MKIGIFAIESGIPAGQNDQKLLPKLNEMIGAGHQVKYSLSKDGVEYFAAFAAKVKAVDLDAVICTDQRLLTHILKVLPDYRQAYNLNGAEKKLSLNDYHGSFIELDGFRLGRDRPLDILFLNPLQHLRTVPEAPFIFKRFISKITHPEKWFPQTEFTWELATEESVEDLYERFKSALLMSSDVETDMDSPHRSINCSGYCALFPDGTTHSIVIPILEMWGVYWMRKFNELPVPKVFQNGLYDNLYFMRYGSPPQAWLYDTQNLFHSWYSELPKRLDYITSFALRRVRFWKDDGKSGGGLHAHYEYNARDCWATLNSCLSLVLEMPAWAKANYLKEFPNNFPCLHVEADGMSLDKKEFDLSRADVEAKLKPHEEKLAKWVSPAFNPGSPVQVKQLLKVLGCADKSGKVESSDEAALNAAAASHPLNELIVSEILEVRGYRKLLSTYLQWGKFWNDRLHCKFNPAGTDTGRLNCQESSFWCGLSLQTIPARDGPVVKRFIKADPGWLLGENDQPQSEARCVGYISGCESLIDLVEGPHDYHSWNAQSFFGIPYSTIYDEVNKKTLNKAIRDLSKRTNHGANYNMGAAVMLSTMGPKKVAEAKSVLKLPAKMTLLEVCAHLLLAYEKTYPEIKKDWYDDLKRTISISKKLVSPRGWTRHFFSDPRSSKPALNAAVAHGPQNLSVDIVNEAFYKVWRSSLYGDLKGKLRVKAQIHDSILYCYRPENLEVPEAVKQLMIIPVQVKDIKGKTRTMTIYPDVSAGAGKTHWNQLK